MKFPFIIIFILLFKYGQSQQCNCDSDPDLKELISCDTVHFKNNAKIYWQYNCDSSWLVFENRKGTKETLYSFEADMMYLTGRIGYWYATEYKFTFMVQNNVISGCCDPPEFILFNKENGSMKKNLGRLIYYSEDPGFPYVAYLNNSNYDSFDSWEYNLLTVLNIDNKNTYKKLLPKGRISKTLELTGELFPEHLFDDPTLEGNILTLSYRYKKNQLQDNWLTQKISLKLK